MTRRSFCSFLSGAATMTLVASSDSAASSEDDAVSSSSSSTTVVRVVDYKAVAQDIRSLIERVPYRGPPLIRLAWHASGTYDSSSQPSPPSPRVVGGSSGGTIRFPEELAHRENAGLEQSAVKLLEPIHQKHGPDGLSYGDLYTLAGVVAVRALGGPCIDWSYGRTDAPDPSSVPPEGRLPTPDTGRAGSDPSDAQHLRRIFGRMGFTDREIVVLSGAHGVGRCNSWASGYDGTWTRNPVVFDNSYFVNLSQRKWKPRQDWNGPLQYTTALEEEKSVTNKRPPKPLMMLPTDLALVRDPTFRKYVVLYANDGALFERDFAVTFQKLLELGTQDLTPCTNLWDEEETN